MAETDSVCLHCGASTKGRKQRGLCSRCYSRPEISGLYPRRKPGPKPGSHARPGKLCRECGVRVACRGGGLCTPCYRVRGVRAKRKMCDSCGFRSAAYGEDLCGGCASGKPAPRRIAEANALLAEVGVGPVAALPWSERRLAALCNRAEAGLPLWRKDDDLGGKYP